MRLVRQRLQGVLTVQKPRDQLRTVFQHLLEKSFSSRISLHTCLHVGVVCQIWLGGAPQTLIS